MIDKMYRIVKTWWLLGLVVGGVSMLIAGLIGFLKIPTITITLSTIDVRSQLASGLSPAAGNKVLAYLQGVVPSSLGGIAAVLISGLVFVILGRIIYEYLPLDRLLWKETPATRLTAVMLYGVLLTGILLSWTLAFPALTVIVAIAIYAAILATAIILANKYLKFPEIPA